MNGLLALVFVSSLLFVNPIPARALSDETFRQLEKIDPYRNPNYEPNLPSPARGSAATTRQRHSPGSMIVGSALKVGLFVGFFAFLAWIYGRMKKKKGRSI